MSQRTNLVGVDQTEMQRHIEPEQVVRLKFEIVTPEDRRTEQPVGEQLARFVIVWQAESLQNWNQNNMLESKTNQTSMNILKIWIYIYCNSTTTTFSGTSILVYSNLE